MKRVYFGTDGVRGIVPDELDVHLAASIGMAAQTVLGGKQPVVLGGDTRISTDLIKAALASGICACGGDVFDAGILPTPGISFITRSMGMEFGGMVSASHNPFEYNGIKFFDSIGRKLPDRLEHEIEKVIESKSFKRANPEDVGRIYFIEDAAEKYSDYLAENLKNVPHFKLGIDCANGATGVSAMLLAEKAGLHVEFINTEPDGKNINLNCGATHPEAIGKFVKEKALDGGFSLDGDGDRILVVDSNGNIISGDQIIAFLALYYSKKNMLNNNTVVVTVMSNYALELMLEKQGIKVLRTPVGDRYVSEKMQETGAVIGGEDSGHIILFDRTTTGDGLLTAAVLLEAMAETGATFEDLKVFEPLPQKLVNVKVYDKNILETDEELRAFIEAKSGELSDRGRILVRPSGTEPLIRIMVEAREEVEAEMVANEIAAKIREKAGV